MSGRRPVWRRVVDVRVGLTELEREVESIPRQPRPEVEQVRGELSEFISRAGEAAERLGQLTAAGGGS